VRAADRPGFDEGFRRISAVPFGIGIAIVLVLANADLVQTPEVNRSALNWVALVAALSIFLVLFFPWHRFDRNLFMLVGMLGTALVAAAVYFSGGWHSRLIALYVLVVAFCAAYFHLREALLCAGMTISASLSPQLYDPNSAAMAEHLVVRAPVFVTLVLLAWYMRGEIARMERSSVEDEERLRAMERLKDRFQREAATDRLTGVANRTRFEELLREEILRADLLQQDFALVLLDLDDFKKINDLHGHRAGDEALKLVAHTLRSGTRQIDTVARYGGEEFVVLLPGASLRDARRFFDRIRNRLLATAPEHLAFPVRLSAGVSRYPDAADTAGELVEVADQAMYHAKRQGKDRII
jgi:diguanylate cyclase (GGDEF)-like protein